MPTENKLTNEEKKLIRRYLIWCYKTAKEDLDRVDRYFTQLQADAFVLDFLLKNQKTEVKKGTVQYIDKIDAFKGYVSNKQKNVFFRKFVDKEGKILQPDYQYLKNRLAAIEKSICHFFDQKELTAIQNLYEEEMTKRILEAREHT